MKRAWGGKGRGRKSERRLHPLPLPSSPVSCMNQTYEAYCVDLSMYFRFSLLVFFFLFLLLLILLLTRPTRVRCLLTLLSTRLPPPPLLAPDLPPCSLPPQHKAYLCHVSGSASHYSESSSSFLSSSGSVQDFFFSFTLFSTQFSSSCLL